jgi:hypothetical protein
MLVPEPDDHGVVVAPLDWELVGPLVVLGLELSHGLAGLGGVGVLILVVGESESGVVVGSLLNDDEELGVVEGLDRHLGHIVEEILVVNGSDGLGLKVDDVDVLGGDVHNDHLPLVEHGEEVNDVWVLVFEENVAVRIHMHHALISPGVDDPCEDVGIVEGGREAEDLGDLVLEDELVLLLEKHISW